MLLLLLLSCSCSCSCSCSPRQYDVFIKHKNVLPTGEDKSPLVSVKYAMPWSGVDRTGKQPDRWGGPGSWRGGRGGQCAASPFAMRLARMRYSSFSPLSAKAHRLVNRKRFQQHLYSYDDSAEDALVVRRRGRGWTYGWRRQEHGRSLGTTNKRWFLSFGFVPNQITARCRHPDCVVLCCFVLLFVLFCFRVRFFLLVVGLRRGEVPGPSPKSTGMAQDTRGDRPTNFGSQHDEEAVVGASSLACVYWGNVSSSGPTTEINNPAVCATADVWTSKWTCGPNVEDVKTSAARERGRDGWGSGAMWVAQ